MTWRWLAVTAVTALAWCTPLRAQRPPLVVAPYATSDGALTTHAGGNAVEPYFPTRALLDADAGGLDIGAPARAWIAWLMARQRPDGGFARYCGSAGAWSECGESDADDAMLALWLALLHRVTPTPDERAAWRSSARRAAAHLAALRDSRTGVFRISRTNQVALLMDNVDVLDALGVVRRARTGPLTATERRTAGGTTEARHARAIARVFRDTSTHGWRVTTQERNANAFYPDVVAQVYPLIASVNAPPDASARFGDWIARHGATWLDRQSDPYPWGSIALGALRLRQPDVARCWAARAAPQRYGAYWTIADDAALQVVEAATGAAGTGEPVPCSVLGVVGIPPRSAHRPCGHIRHRIVARIYAER